jgi:hypothetical protein
MEYFHFIFYQFENEVYNFMIDKFEKMDLIQEFSKEGQNL